VRNGLRSLPAGVLPDLHELNEALLANRPESWVRSLDAQAARPTNPPAANGPKNSGNPAVLFAAEKYSSASSRADRRSSQPARAPATSAGSAELSVYRKAERSVAGPG